MGESLRPYRLAEASPSGLISALTFLPSSGLPRLFYFRAETAPFFDDRRPTLPLPLGRVRKFSPPFSRMVSVARFLPEGMDNTRLGLIGSSASFPDVIPTLFDGCPLDVDSFDKHKTPPPPRQVLSTW